MSNETKYLTKEESWQLVRDTLDKYSDENTKELNKLLMGPIRKPSLFKRLITKIRTVI